MLFAFLFSLEKSDYTENFQIILNPKSSSNNKKTFILQKT